MRASRFGSRQVKRIGWPKAGSRARTEPNDAAPTLLRHIVSAIERRVPDVLHVPVDVSTSLPVCTAAADAEYHRLWSCDAGRGVRIWMSIDHANARGLLEIVLGGPASTQFTTLEREIVKETVERLTSASGVSWDEEPLNHRPSTDRVWRSSIDIEASSGVHVTIDFNAPAMPAPSPVPCVSGERIPILVRAEVARGATPLSEVAAWRPGTVVSLRADSTSSNVGLFAGKVRIATALLGASQGNRALRLAATPDGAR